MKILKNTYRSFYINIFICSIIHQYSFGQINEQFIFHPYPNEISSWKFTPTSISIGFNGSLYFLDAINQSAAVITDDSKIKITELTTSDPVDIVQSGLSVWVLDQMNNKIDEYDLSFNLVHTHTVPQDYPEMIIGDKNGNIYMVSTPNYAVWKNPWQHGQEFPFIDLENYQDIISNIIDIDINKVHNLVLLDENSVIHSFNMVGNYLSSNQTKISDASFVIWQDNTWIALGDDLNTIHTSNVNDKTKIIDIDKRDNILVILTAKGWYQSVQ